MTALTIAGGVALILFGLRFLRKGLDRLFGPRLAHWMNRLADTRLKACVTGLGISIVTPSSTTMSVLAVQTVQAGHMTSRQMLALVFGADIGLTLMVALIALRLEQYAPVLVLIGVLLFQFTKAARSRGIGQVTLSLGFLLLGIDIIKGTVAEIEFGQDMLRLIEIANHYPLAMAILAAVLSILMQSSTATIGLVIGLGMSKAEALPLSTAVAAVVGANVGIVITTLLVGWSRIESRRLAFGNLAVKLVVAAAAIVFLGSVTDLLERVPAGHLDHLVAMTHTGFNLVVAMVGLPLVGLICRLFELAIPTPPRDESAPFGPRYVGGTPPESITLALGQSMREIMRVTEIVRQMFDDVWLALVQNDAKMAKLVGERDDDVDLLDSRVKRYLIELTKMADEPGGMAQQMFQLRYLNEMETIGDIIDKNLSELVAKKARLNSAFSADGMDELDQFYQMVARNLLTVDTAFATRDRSLAQQVLAQKPQIKELEQQMQECHFARLTAGLAESRRTSSVHLDILTYLKSINSHVSHAAEAILDEPPVNGE